MLFCSSGPSKLRLALGPPSKRPTPSLARSLAQSVPPPAPRRLLIRFPFSFYLQPLLMGCWNDNEKPRASWHLCTPEGRRPNVDISSRLWTHVCVLVVLDQVLYIYSGSPLTPHHDQSMDSSKRISSGAIASLEDLHNLAAYP